jgi:hypothetical protein
LQGYRLVRDGYERIEPQADGGIPSVELDARLNLEGDDLAIFDTRSGQRWQTAEEFEEAARRQEEAGRLAAEARAAELEAELQRLREQLDSGKPTDDR